MGTGKNVFIAEKPSVGESFASAMKVPMKKHQGYLEGDKAIITWCYGHLVTMSYPEVYDEKLRRWNLETLPFIPNQFLYEVIGEDNVKKQFQIVSGLLNRDDVTGIYVCTDSGREGEYIYRLVDQMAQVSDTKDKRRVWIDSQTDEEIIRGIREAKPLSAYDRLSDAAYLRAKEDYLMGINFSRLLTLKYGQTFKNFLHAPKNTVIAVGRVMTCVLGLIVRREREIRDFQKTPFYRVSAQIGELGAKADWKATEGSAYFASPDLYKDSGFLHRETAQELVNLIGPVPVSVTIAGISRKKEKKKPPLLFNLAELQNECSKRFKISPDETLKCVQELYEKKLVTYPRTDARVLSSAVAKEIDRNINGLLQYAPLAGFAQHVLDVKSYEGLEKTQYVNDKKITDHYALVPTGRGMNQISRLSERLAGVYDLIARRFLSIFYPPAEYQKVGVVTQKETETSVEKFFSNFKVLTVQGYLEVAGLPGKKGKDAKEDTKEGTKDDARDDSEDDEVSADEDMLARLSSLKKGMSLTFSEVTIKEGETKPPKRYSSGSMILAMENAGQLIEDEELRAQIKGAGIGTSATRAEILSKLQRNKYIALNKKTQILTPTLLGEMIFDTVDLSIRPLLNPELTASWEKGLSMVEQGEVSSEEYMQKLETYIRSFTSGVMNLQNHGQLRNMFEKAASNYTSEKARRK